MVSKVALVLATLFLSPCAIALPAKTKSLMRRNFNEQEHGPNGQRQISEPDSWQTAARAMISMKPESEPKLRDFGKYDFILGDDMSSNCTNQYNAANMSFGKEKLMNDPTMCMFAATLSGATVLESVNKFEVPAATPNENQHPQGCFKDACTLFGSTSTASTCYYFNNKGDPKPDNIQSGTPVCYRLKFVRGKRDHNPDPSATNDPVCPLGYSSVQSNHTCQYTDVPPVMNANDFYRHSIDYPQGCFIMQDDTGAEKVYFNSRVHDQTNISGTPVCMVSTTMNPW